MEENYGHKPVLLHECLGALAIKPDGIYVDGTLGRAGHSLDARVPPDDGPSHCA